MITHIVLFKFKDKEAVNKAKEMLTDMEGKIPQLRYLEVGADILRSERSYDLALVSKFDSMEDLDAYQVHPVHEKVKEYILSVRDSSVSVDYES